MITGLNHVSIVVPDIEAAARSSTTSTGWWSDRAW